MKHRGSFRIRGTPLTDITDKTSLCPSVCPFVSYRWSLTLSVFFQATESAVLRPQILPSTPRTETSWPTVRVPVTTGWRLWEHRCQPWRHHDIATVPTNSWPSPRMTLAGASSRFRGSSKNDLTQASDIWIHRHDEQAGTRWWLVFRLKSHHRMIHIIYRVGIIIIIIK